MMTIGQPTPGSKFTHFFVPDTQAALTAFRSYNVPAEVYAECKGRVIPIERLEMNAQPTPSVMSRDPRTKSYWFPVAGVVLLESDTLPYHAGKSREGVNYDAGDLLETMRADTEAALQACVKRFGLGRMLTCSSQSARATQAVDLLKEDKESIRNCSLSTAKMFAEFSDINNLLRRLKSFLAVHHTVSLMEGKH